jgi:hypothetical protein
MTTSLKRWKVTSKVVGGEIKEVTLRPDNKALQPIVVTPGDGDVRVIAECLETVG